MEARLQPRTEGNQRCLEFDLSLKPRAQATYYHDYLGNIVHHFNIPERHAQLTITAEALVEIHPLPPLPPALSMNSWTELDHLKNHSDFWDMLQPSHFAKPTHLLQQLAAELGLKRIGDPLTVLRRLNGAVYNAFAYAPQTTKVDSPIDEALASRRGVCQDFSHIMIALVRSLEIPCRYVSGYLYHREKDGDRSAEDATHAWVETYLPELGWVGFDPTNNLIATDRHIRVAVGRDYADVSPTRGIFKGDAESELSVGVRVGLADAPKPEKEELLPETEWSPVEEDDEEDRQFQQQQQQQQ